jgi:CRISPR type III-A-associated RAMP protein Csm4
MSSGFIIRLRPAGPWRFGPSSGARDRVDRIFHSDSLYSGLTHAMLQLGKLDEWLSATATAATPAVRLSSCFPYLGEMLMATPPRGTWPPAVSTKVRWKGARFVPVSAIATLLRDKPLDDDRWIVDPESECLLPVEKNVAPSSPFRVTVRTSAAVDRAEHGKLELHSTACLEFAEGAGLWSMAMFADAASEAEWSEPVKAAFRLLADTGVGGERSRGWGRSAQPEFRPLSDLGLNIAPADAAAYWLLSVYTPAAGDQIDWKRGNYSLITRGGRIESAARWGDEKQLLRMVEEGSVIFADAPPNGAARNVAPEGFPHPVYRSGFALAIAIPWKGTSPEKPRVAEPAPEQKIPEPLPPSFEYEPTPLESLPASIEPEPIESELPAAEPSSIEPIAAGVPEAELPSSKLEPASIESEPSPIESHPENIKPSAAAIEPETITTEVPAVELPSSKLEPSAIESESSPIESHSEKIKPSPATIEPELITAEVPEAELPSSKLEPSAIESESSPIESHSEKIKPSPATIEPETIATEVPAAELPSSDWEPASIESEPSSIKSHPVNIEPSPTAIEPEPIATEAPPAELPSSKWEPASIESEPSPIESQPVNIEPSTATIEPEPIASEAPPAELPSSKVEPGAIEYEPEPKKPEPDPENPEGGAE